MRHTSAETSAGPKLAGYRCSHRTISGTIWNNASTSTDSKLSANFSPEVQVILKTKENMECFRADNSSLWVYLEGAGSTRWNNALLRELRDIYGADFEAVNQVGTIVNENSSRVLDRE